MVRDAPIESSRNILDAAANGTSDGLRLAANVGAMLISFIALVSLLNAIIGVIPLGGEPLSLQRILGWGFAPWSGGPFAWLDLIGAARAVAIAQSLTATCGPRFTPPKLLTDMAASGETFYSRFAARAA